MIAVARSQLEPTARLQAHLDHCLTCRACERICPSGVPYGRLIDAARAMIRGKRPPPPLTRLVRRFALDGLLTRAEALRGAALTLRLIQYGRLDRLAGLVGLREWAALLPRIPAAQPFHAYYPPRGMERGQVALFVGCIASVVDRVTLEAALRVLTGLGFGVHVPPAQGCCGALHLHDGQAQRARALALRNIDAFGPLAVDAVITTASGCGALLAEYSQLDFSAARERGQAQALSRRVRDISQFLVEAALPEPAALRPLEARVAVHDPCSLRNVLRHEGAPYVLLRRIPQLQVIALPGNERCCGAAGTYMLTEPAMARSLRRDKLDALRATGCDMLVSSNVGCALHLAQGIRLAGLTVEVTHPVVLLDRQLHLDPRSR